MTRDEIIEALQNTMDPENPDQNDQLSSLAAKIILQQDEEIRYYKDLSHINMGAYFEAYTALLGVQNQNKELKTKLSKGS